LARAPDAPLPKAGGYREIKAPGSLHVKRIAKTNNASILISTIVFYWSCERLACRS
jgi:hypothetical protein